MFPQLSFHVTRPHSQPPFTRIFTECGSRVVNNDTCAQFHPRPYRHCSVNPNRYHLPRHNRFASLEPRPPPHFCQFSQPRHASLSFMAIFSFAHLSTPSLNALQHINTPMRPLVISSTRFYTALTLVLSALQLRYAIINAHPHATARAAVQLLTATALLPVCALSADTSPFNKRSPVLSAFVLTFSLIIDPVLRVLTAIEVLSSPQKPNALHSRAPIILTRLAASLIAVFLFRSYSHLHHQVFPNKSNRKSSLDTAHSPAFAALYLHALTAALSHLCDVIALYAHSTVLTASLDIVSSFITVACATPLLQYTTAVLMHATPPSLANAIKSAREEVLALEGVLSCANLHVWEETAGLLVGTLCVEVDGRVSKSWVLEKAIAAFEGVVDDLTIQVESWRGDQISGDKPQNSL